MDKVGLTIEKAPRQRGGGGLQVSVVERAELEVEGVLGDGV